MVAGVSGQNVLKNVVEDGGQELVMILSQNMEEKIVQKNMDDLAIKKVATLMNALVSKNNTFKPAPICLDE